MKPTLYPNGFPSAYEELKTFYPVFYRDVFEMDAIWRAAGGGLDEIEDGVDAVVNNNFVSLMDTDALAQMETFLGIPLNQKRTLEARRKLVASYFIGGNHIGAREIKDITRAFTEGTCEVSFVGGTVYIHVKSDIKDTPPEDDYCYILRKKIPAHLGVYTNIEIEFSERLYVGSNALEGNRYDIVPPPPVGQSAAGELRTGSYITQSDRTGIDLHPQPGLSFETGLHAAAVVLESSKTAVDLPAPERRSAQNALHARTGMVESSRTAADMILYSGREDIAESTVRTGAAYAQTTFVAIAPAFQQERAPQHTRPGPAAASSRTHTILCRQHRKGVSKWTVLLPPTKALPLSANCWRRKAHCRLPASQSATALLLHPRQRSTPSCMS